MGRTHAGLRGRGNGRSEAGNCESERAGASAEATGASENEKASADLPHRRIVALRTTSSPGTM